VFGIAHTECRDGEDEEPCDPPEEHPDCHTQQVTSYGQAAHRH
jgi:hypothetical protein